MKRSINIKSFQPSYTCASNTIYNEFTVIIRMIVLPMLMTNIREYVDIIRTGVTKSFPKSYTCVSNKFSTLLHTRGEYIRLSVHPSHVRARAYRFAFKGL
jgi:hypothetical protein